MGDHFQFTRNYNDLCTNKGFQFEFCCDRCGTGYRTKFQSSATGLVTEALDTASSLFGGLFGQVANVSERVRSAGWEKAHDEAFIEAIEENLGQRAEKNFLPLQPGDVPATYADISDLSRDTGYAPKTGVKEGIKNFVEWYRDFYRV